MTKSPYIFSHLAKCSDNHSLGIRSQVLFLGNHPLMKAQNQVWNVQYSHLNFAQIVFDSKPHENQNRLLFFQRFQTILNINEDCWRKSSKLWASSFLPRVLLLCQFFGPGWLPGFHRRPFWPSVLRCRPVSSEVFGSLFLCQDPHR